ncbi:MAG: hypothetical protein ABFD20_05245 [Anaerolineales bacterium]
MTAVADWLLFASVLLINLGSAMMHWARGRRPAWAHTAGLVVVGAALPVAIVGLLNTLAGRSLAHIALPLTYVVWAVGAYLLDYRLKIEFRDPRRPLLFGPYLVLFYVSVIALWAFTWPLGVWAWLPTAASYVLHIAALIDAQARGHG